MFDLTKQERFVLIFLGLTILSGTVVQHFLKQHPNLSRDISILEKDEVFRKIDLNRATFNELVNLPWIGPTLAQRIVDYRMEKGEFQSLEELKDIPGIKQSGYEKIAKYLKISKRHAR